MGESRKETDEGGGFYFLLSTPLLSTAEGRRRVRKREKRPGREPGDFVGSTPTSATEIRKAAGYGWPGRIANACSLRECGFESHAFRWRLAPQ